MQDKMHTVWTILMLISANFVYSLKYLINLILKRQSFRTLLRQLFWNTRLRIHSTLQKSIFELEYCPNATSPAKWISIGNLPDAWRIIWVLNAVELIIWNKLWQDQTWLVRKFQIRIDTFRHFAVPPIRLLQSKQNLGYVVYTQFQNLESVSIQLVNAIHSITLTQPDLTSRLNRYR